MCLVALPAGAKRIRDPKPQEKTADRRVVVDSVRLAHNEIEFTVSARIVVDKKKMWKREAIVLTPVLRSENYRHAFESFNVSGRRRLSARRAEKLSKKLPYELSSAIIPGTIRFNRALPYEPWMSAADLILEEQIYVSNNLLLGTDTLLLFRSTLPEPEPQPEPVFEEPVPELEPEFDSIQPIEPFEPIIVEPQEEPVAMDLSPGPHEFLYTAWFDFEKGRGELEYDFGENVAWMRELKATIDSINNNPRAMVDYVEICGYSSPDGSARTNGRLAENRAWALKRWIQRRSDWADDVFMVHSVDEDWDGLHLMVSESDLKDKQKIIDAIEFSDLPPDILERKLKTFDDFKTIHDDIYPHLRRVECTFYYRVLE